MSNDMKAVITLVVAAFLILGMVIWSTAGADVRSSVVSGLFTIVAALGAAGVAFWQLRKQAENTIAGNRHNEAIKLKKEVYAELLPLLKSASDASVSVSSYARIFVSQMHTANYFEKRKQPIKAPSSRYTELLVRQAAMTEEVTKLLGFAENWEIIDSRMEIFRLAFHDALFDIHDAEAAYQRHARTTMPIENAEGQAYPWTSLNLDIKSLEAETERYTDVVSTLTSYILDFRVEMQMLLLSELFKDKVNARVPLNPKYKVIRLDHYSELKAYFATTPAGLNAAKVNAEVVQSLSTLAA